MRRKQLKRLVRLPSSSSCTSAYFYYDMRKKPAFCPKSELTLVSLQPLDYRTCIFIVYFELCKHALFAVTFRQHFHSSPYFSDPHAACLSCLFIVLSIYCSVQAGMLYNHPTRSLVSILNTVGGTDLCFCFIQNTTTPILVISA